MSLEIGGVTASNADSISTGNSNTASQTRRITRTIGADGTIIIAKYLNEAAAAAPDADFSQRWLSARPVSLG
jgi:hypothetical protein